MFELKDYLALRPKGSELQLAGVSPTPSRAFGDRTAAFARLWRPYGDAYQPVSVIR
jgi:hypothetical protein